MVDTGADITVLTEHTATRLKCELVPSSRILTGADGSKLDVVGETELHLVSALGVGVRTRVGVLRGARHNLLGKPEIREFGLLKSVNTVGQGLGVERKYPKLFGILGTLPDTFKINLREGSEPLCLHVPRRLPIGLREATKLELERMERLGVIEKVERPTEWCSGMVVAPKSNGKVRICVDLTQLNKSVKREVYPLPRLEETLSEIEGSQFFSKMDANSGFWQIGLDEESRDYTAFITPFGRYVFCKMPFGISAAPEFFQRQMCKILQGLGGVVCMMDDILVVGRTKQEHDERLARVLESLEEAGLTLNKEKCEFGVSEVRFLGHILNREGIRVDPDKERAIREMEAPTDRRSLRRFLAMVGYLSRFSPDLAEAQLPLQALDKNDAQWLWSPAQQASFERVKEIISSAPVLTLFDSNGRHRVTADASRHTLGAALLQRNESGEWQPVSYASRKMTETEGRYGQIEKEALAITWACEKFDFYLVGRDFQIETDHKPLITLLGQKDLSDLPLRVQRFKMRLMRYRYDIFHTPGSQMYLADLLSRPASPKESVKVGRVERHVMEILQAEGDGLVEEIRARGQEDPDYMSVVKAVEGGWPSEVSGELRALKSNREALSVVGGLVMMNARLYVPRVLREEMLERLHRGHQGGVKTYRRSQEAVWWPTIRREVLKMVEHCPKCIRERRIANQPLRTSELPEGPWQVVGTDLMDFEGEVYVIFVDYFSRWIEVAKMRDQTGGELVRRFTPFLARYGAPRCIRSDNGPCYVSKEWKSLMKRYHIELTTSSPHYPASNGMAERAVEIVKGMWRKEGKNEALLAYRTTPLESGNRPDELMLGRRLRNGLPLQDVQPFSTEEFRRKDGLLKERQKRNFDGSKRARSLPALKEGDHVWVKRSNNERGSQAVVSSQADEPDSYWVDMDGRLVRRTRKHLRLLPREAKDSEEGGLEREEPEEGAVAGGDRTAVSSRGRVVRRRRDDAYVYYD